MTLVYRSTVGRRLTVSEGDGNISHLASGSVISVKQAPFNAVGDGVTDDTAAIAAALATGARRVIFPEGYTFITQGLSVSTAKQEVVIRSTVKLKNSTNQPVFTAAANRVKFRFEGGEIDGNKANQTTVTDGEGEGIWLANGIDKVEIWDPYIHDTKRSGIAGYGNNDGCVVIGGEIADVGLMGIYPSQASNRPNKRWQISGVEISGFGQDGIGTVAIQHSIISGNRIVHPTDGVAVTGIALEAECNYTNVFGNTIEGTATVSLGGVGIQINDCHNINVFGNNCKGLGIGIGVTQGGTSTYAISINDNTFDDCGYSGMAIQLSPSSAGSNYDIRAKITGNIINNCPYAAIYVASSSHCDVSHNQIYGVNLQNSTNKRYVAGIVLIGGSYYNTVTCNTIIEGTGGNLKIGIHEQATAGGDHSTVNTIKDNRIVGADYDIVCCGTANGQTVVSKVTRLSDASVAAAPTTGHWERGDEVLNEQPAAAGVPGWVCTTSGTFGSAPTATGAITNGLTLLTLTNTTGLYTGMKIRVAGAGVASADLDTYIKALDSTGVVATLLNAASTTVAGAVITFLNPVFKAQAVLAA